MDTLEKQFTSRVSAFLRRTGMGPTTLGLKALGDPNFLRQIERGRSPSLRTADRVLSFISESDGDPGGARAPSQRRRAGTSWPRARTASTRDPLTGPPPELRAHPPTRVLRRPEVEARTGLSRATIYVRMRQNRFPLPVSLGQRAVGWIEAEVEAWIRERIAESRGEEIRTTPATEDRAEDGA